MGFSNSTLAEIAKISDEEFEKITNVHSIKPCYKMVDTCAAEFEAKTPYYYSSYDGVDYDGGDELQVSDNRKIIILGAGPIE